MRQPNSRFVVRPSAGNMQGAGLKTQHLQTGSIAFEDIQQQGETSSLTFSPQVEV